MPTSSSPSFVPSAGGPGAQLRAIGSADDSAQSVLVQPDGKIVVAGYTFNGANYDFSLIRLNTDGTLDTAFADGGQLIVATSDSNDFAYDVARQRNGSLVVAGCSWNGNDYDVSVIRVTGNGALDGNFGTGGKVSVDLGGNDYAQSVSVLSDGSILLAGDSSASASGDGFSMVRLTSTGALDPIFGNGTGSVIVPVGLDGLGVGSSLVALYDVNGQILVGGYSFNGNDYDYSVIRLDSDGTVDTSFGPDHTGKVVVATTQDEFGMSLAVDSHGRILLAGTIGDGITGYQFGVICLTTWGTVDVNFGTDGKVAIPVGTDGYADRLVVLDSGKLLVSGFSSTAGGDYDFSVIRLNANGSLDGTFGTGGIATYGVGDHNDFAYGLAVDGSGKILIAGESDSGSATDFSLMRLSSNGQLDATFNAPTLGGTVSFTENSSPIALDSSVALYDPVLGALNGGLGNYAGASITLQRAGGADGTDVFSGLGRLVLSAGSASLDGTTVGTATNIGGQLVITFNNYASQARVNEVLSSIGYRNTSDALPVTPVTTAKIDWTFYEGLAGGGLSDTGSTTINFTGVNDAPTGNVSLNGITEVGVTLTATNTLADLDGLGDLSYAWLREGTVVAGATAATYTLSQADVGAHMSVQVSYTDGGGTHEMVGSAPSALVTVPVGLLVTGTVSNEILTGGNGNDTLNGNGGTDTLIGGLGDDTYIVDSTGDVVQESPSQGTDTVQSSATYTLPANVEQLTLTGTGAINGTGNTQDNVITGNSGNNTLDGGAGNDSLVGGSGNDSLVGGSGNDSLDGGSGTDSMTGGTGDDIYVVDSTSDVLKENPGEGTDTVLSSVSLTLASNIENLILTGSLAISGTGNTLDNVMTGNSAANTLSGGSGSDTMAGGAGNDTYVVDSLGDVVQEYSGGGTDTVQSSISLTLGSELENLTLTGTAISGTGNALNNLLTGNASANVLDGGVGNDTLSGGTGIDTLIGGAGDDTYVVDAAGDVVVENLDGGTDLVQSSAATYVLPDNVEKLTLTGTGNISGTGNTLDNLLTGNSGNNTLDGGDGNDSIVGGSGNDTLLGGAGNDTLSGGTGTDSMVGGDGNDTYVVDATNDVVVEIAGQGIDLVQSTAPTYLLPDNVEQLILTGSSNISGTGNAGDNLLTGNTGANSLGGGDGNDTLMGGSGNDTLAGGIGTDWLDGGSGNDSMSGGAGDDTYVVDSTSDVLYENSNEGNDTVRSSVSLTLGNNLENLILTGTSAINGTGNALDNVITGNSAVNTLNGLGGNDIMAGGAGNDIYLVDSASDVVKELESEGTDLVQSSAPSYVLPDNVERLTLTGISNISGSGNSLDNLLTGNTGNNSLDGGDGNDSIVGGSGNDTLLGGTGNDTLDGGSGTDSMVGGAGDDIYVVNSASDVVFEDLSAGIDTVNSSASLTLAANVENLTLTGTSGLTGTGNALANLLTGNTGNNSLSGGAGNDVLNGGAGTDTLTGGTGADTFVFDNLTSVDRITDFVAGYDTIRLVGSTFTGLPAGVLDAGAFVIGTMALDASDRIIYNNGLLYFDVDGVGGTAQVQIATLVGVPALTAADFVVV